MELPLRVSVTFNRVNDVFYIRFFKRINVKGYQLIKHPLNGAIQISDNRNFSNILFENAFGVNFSLPITLSQIITGGNEFKPKYGFFQLNIIGTNQIRVGTQFSGSYVFNLIYEV